MTVTLGKNTDCPTIKHLVTTLDSKAISEAFSELEDMIFRLKKSKVLCDMTNIDNCTLSDSDFEQLKGGMFHILLQAPADFKMAVAVSCEKLRSKLEYCHNEIRDTGFKQGLFVAMSHEEALSVLNPQ